MREQGNIAAIIYEMFIVYHFIIWGSIGIKMEVNTLYLASYHHLLYLLYSNIRTNIVRMFTIHWGRYYSKIRALPFRFLKN